jgi:hypothetical protein
MRGVAYSPVVNPSNTTPATNGTRPGARTIIPSATTVRTMLATTVVRSPIRSERYPPGSCAVAKLTQRTLRSRPAVVFVRANSALIWGSSAGKASRMPSARR